MSLRGGEHLQRPSLVCCRHTLLCTAVTLAATAWTGVSPNTWPFIPKVMLMTLKRVETLLNFIKLLCRSRACAMWLHQIWASAWSCYSGILVVSKQGEMQALITARWCPRGLKRASTMLPELCPSESRAKIHSCFSKYYHNITKLTNTQTFLPFPVHFFQKT